jgi:hypothetical protein
VEEMMLGFEPKNVFNADELGLFYKLLLKRTLAKSLKECVRGKTSKERVTVLLCASRTGGKLPALVIGKSRNPRCFMGVKMETIGAKWASNKNVWMTATLFGD